MSREDLVDHIVSEMNRAGATTDVAESPDSVLCQNCGAQIIHESTSETGELTDYVVHRVPEHGTNEMSSVFYCGSDCFQRSIKDLFDYSDETGSSY